jgi:hypothetical protein
MFGFFTCGIWNIDNFKAKYLADIESSSISKAEEVSSSDADGKDSDRQGSKMLDPLEEELSDDSKKHNIKSLV